MVEAEIEGIGRVWVDISQLRNEGPHRHPPFSEDIRRVIRGIREALHEVYPGTLTEWEDGFRRDKNFEQEVAIFFHIASIHEGCTKERPFSHSQRQEYYTFLLACSMSPKVHLPNIVKLAAVSRQDAEQVVELFFE